MTKKFPESALILLLLATCLLSAPTFSQDRETKPQGIIPEPGKKSDLEVSISTNQSLYQPREEVIVNYEVSQTSFLYLYSIDTQGQVTLLFPNKYDRDNKVKPGKGELPGRGYSFLAGKEEGREYLQIIASKVELPVFPSPESKDSQSGPFLNLATDPGEFETATTKQINETTPEKNWDTDWVSMEVTRKTARLSISSTPTNARIYIDGDFAGTTPDAFDVRPGQRDVKVLLGTDLKWQGKVTAEANQVKNVTAALERVNYSSLLIKSNPPGAKITVNGDYRGETPRRISVESGEIEVELDKNGYWRWQREIRLYPGETRTIEAVLESETEAGPGFELDIPVSVGLNAGGIGSSPPSFGTDLSFSNWIIGGSLRLTGSSELPENINWKKEDYQGEELNYGPETEVYSGYQLEVLDWIYLSLGAGIAIQQKAQLPLSNTDANDYPIQPQAIVARNAERIFDFHPTLHGGFLFEQNRVTFQLTYHSRRGPVLGIGYRF